MLSNLGKNSLILIASRPAVGKTTLMLNLQESFCKKGKKCLYLSDIKFFDIEKRIEKEKPDYVFIDFIETKIDTKYLKTLAENKDITIFLTASAKRSLEKRKDKRPKISDIKACNEFIKHCDEILLLYRPYYYSCENKEDERIFEVNLAKNLHCKITLDYDRQNRKIFDL